MSIEVITVPAFQDNYLWLFHRTTDNIAYVVDPGDAQAIEKALEEHQLQLGGILITHHHFDHTGGIDALLERWKVPVYGPRGDSVAQVTHPLGDGDYCELAAEIKFQVLEVPGHTLDHIAYFNAEAPLLFCGDTLFAGGCGRLFEGTAAQMYDSLAKLAALPSNTAVYCAHEYTMANLAFAKAVEPSNAELQARVLREQAKREQQQPTVPTSIELELATNPFMRCDQDSVRQAATSRSGENLTTGATVLGAVRRWKDEF